MRPCTLAVYRCFDGTYYKLLQSVSKVQTSRKPKTTCITFLRSLKQCSPEGYRRFGVTFCLYPQFKLCRLHKQTGIKAVTQTHGSGRYRPMRRSQDGGNQKAVLPFSHQRWKMRQCKGTDISRDTLLFPGNFRC